MPKTISTLEMTKEEWLKERKIGSSDVSAILGLNPWKTPLMVYEEKTADAPPVLEENRAMQRGHKMEQTVAELYVEETGRKILRDNKIRIHPSYDFLRCNLDRVILPSNGEGRGILEIKTATSMSAKTWETELPTWYFCQVQHQFDVTRMTWGVLALLIIDTWELKLIDLTADEHFLKAQRDVLVDFWANNVQKRIPPTATVPDFEIMLSKPGQTVEADDEVAAYVGQLAQVKKDLKAVETVKENLEAKIKEAIGDAEMLAHNGRILATWKSQTQERFDQKRFKAEQADLAAQYIKQIAFRVLRFKEIDQ